MLTRQHHTQQQDVYTTKYFMINGHHVEIITRNKEMYRVIHKLEHSCYVEHYEKGSRVAVYSYSCPWHLLPK